MDKIDSDGFGAPNYALRDKLLRLLWFFVESVINKLFPFSVLRCMSLRLFGARIGRGCRVYSNVTVWWPGNLVLGDYVALGRGVTVYNQGRIKIGDRSVVSQGAHLCASTHDYNDKNHPLVLADIQIGENVWVCADAFVGPGVNAGNGVVIGARAVLMKDADDWTVYAGNPAVGIKSRNRFL